MSDETTVPETEQSRALARSGESACTSQNEPERSTALEHTRDACERCGKPGAAKFGDQFICDECYIACGSCCAGDE